MIIIYVIIFICISYVYLYYLCLLWVFDWFWIIVSFGMLMQWWPCRRELSSRCVVWIWDLTANSLGLQCTSDSWEMVSQLDVTTTCGLAGASRYCLVSFTPIPPFNWSSEVLILIFLKTSQISSKLDDNYSTKQISNLLSPGDSFSYSSWQLNILWLKDLLS